jgi:hypothetical protein
VTVENLSEIAGGVVLVDVALSDFSKYFRTLQYFILLALKRAILTMQFLYNGRCMQFTVWKLLVVI